jgi:hypothetical protein
MKIRLRGPVRCWRSSATRDAQRAKHRRARPATRVHRVEAGDLGNEPVRDDRAPKRTHAPVGPVVREAPVRRTVDQHDVARPHRLRDILRLCPRVFVREREALPDRDNTGTEECSYQYSDHDADDRQAPARSRTRCRSHRLPRDRRWARARSGTCAGRGTDTGGVTPPRTSRSTATATRRRAPSRPCAREQRCPRRTGRWRRPPASRARAPDAGGDARSAGALGEFLRSDSCDASSSPAHR